MKQAIKNTLLSAECLFQCFSFGKPAEYSAGFLTFILINNSHLHGYNQTQQFLNRIDSHYYNRCTDSVIR